MKMKSKNLARVVCFLILFGAYRLAIAGDACQNMVSDWRFDLVLKGAELSVGAGFVGTFELSSVKYDRTLILPGRRVGTALMMENPDVSVQFLDLNLQWISFAELAGTFLGQPDRLEVKRGSRGTIMATLMSPEIAKSSGSEFRIMLRLHDPDICVISRPFHALPMRPPVTGFEASR